VSVCGAVARCMECGESGVPVGVMFSADALERFERYLAPAVVFALHACQPSGKPLRGKGVVRGRYLCLARLGASKGNVPPIGVKHYPSGLTGRLRWKRCAFTACPRMRQQSCPVVLPCPLAAGR